MLVGTAVTKLLGVAERTAGSAAPAKVPGAVDSLELVDNQKRLHSAIDYAAPRKFERP